MLPSKLIEFKKKGEKIFVLTAWDSISAGLVDQAGVHVVLVGDSLSMVALGHETTLPISVEDMLHHTQAVCRGMKNTAASNPLIICDLPFLSYQCGVDKAVESAGKLIKNSCASAVKVEGAEPETLSIIARLIRVGIPVMGHVGLTPQSVLNQGLRQQGKDIASQTLILNNAKKLEEAGCFSIVLEHIPSELSKSITNTLNIPTIGIGAGIYCDGQVRVTADILGLTETQPPFSEPMIEGRKIFIEILSKWIQSN
tara:strand:- start:281 stop:1045 length:765 start_codon:yes stop_codon:yes gene_type:complete